MSEQKESSVLFSLKELMNLEEDRIRQEEDDKKNRAQAEAKARDDAERKAREEEAARVAADEERKRLEASRQREETARLEAMRAAEIEKQKIEAERRAQLEAMSKQQEHARQLEMIKQDEGKKKLRNMIFGISGAAVLTFGGIAGYVFGVYLPAKEKEKMAQDAALKVQMDEAEKAKREAAQAMADVKRLQEDLASAKDEKSRAEIAARLAAAQEDLTKKSRPSGGPGPATGGPGTPPAAKGPGKACPPGDPLCGF